MAVIFSDTLADSAAVTLQAHAPVGSPTAFTWTKTGAQDLICQADNKWRSGGSGLEEYLIEQNIGSANHSVSVWIKAFDSGTIDTFCGVIGAHGDPLGFEGIYFGVRSGAQATSLRMFGWDFDGNDLFTEVQAAVPAEAYNALAEYKLVIEDGVAYGYVNDVLQITQAIGVALTGEFVGLTGGVPVSAEDLYLTGPFTAETVEAEVEVEPTPILHIAGFTSKIGHPLVVRMQAKDWEFYRGRNWDPIVSGTMQGLSWRRIYTTAFKGLLIAANGQDRLLQWDGHPNHAVERVSSEAPRAYYVVRIGNRLFCAKIKSNSPLDFNPDEVAWSADDDIEEWTDAVAGAGRAVIHSETRGSDADHISGLSTLERGVILYRHRSLVLVSKTGVRVAPFRFQTIDAAHGTKSPYSIASGGLALGDFFLGSDYVVYHFDGAGPPIPIGLPIQSRLEERITDLEECVGFIDMQTMEYHLVIPTEENNRPILNEDYIFNIKDYIRKQKLVWRFRDLVLPDESDEVTTGAYVPEVPTNYIPVVDEYDDPLTDIVDDPPQDTTLVDALVQTTAGKVLFGTNLGETYQIDVDTVIHDGTWLSKQLGKDHELITVDRVRLVASAEAVAYVGVSVTWDGGLTYEDEVVVRIEPANRNAIPASGWHPSTGHLFQMRLRFISGDCIVHELNIWAQPRGRAA